MGTLTLEVETQGLELYAARGVYRRRGQDPKAWEMRSIPTRAYAMETVETMLEKMFDVMESEGIAVSGIADSKAP